MPGTDELPSRAPLEAPLAALERRLDGPVQRVAALFGVRWRERERRRKSEAIQSITESSMANEESSQRVAAALSAALRRGACESAERLLHRLMARPGALQLVGPPGVVAVVEGLLMLGEVDLARELAANYAHTLASTPAGMSFLELLGLPGSRDWLPNGKPNLLRLSRSIAAGKLTAEGLVQLVGERRWSFARSPELHLLFCNALRGCDNPAAKRFLNRYLRLYGSDVCSSCSTVALGNALDALLFEEAQPVCDGPLVSVLVAAHQAAETVGRAIDSLLAQSYQNLEVLVADDASTDGTLDVLRQRRASDARLRVFRSQQNQGAYNVRNALAERAQGALLTFHDADDLALPHRVVRQVARLKAAGTVACVGNLVRIRPNGAFVFHRDQTASRLAPVTLMLTRAAFAAVGPFRSARVGADLELYTKLQARFSPSRVRRIRSPLIFALWSPGSATLAQGMEALEDGYRSPARRSYSELVCGPRLGDGQAPTDLEIDERLRTWNNYAAARELSEVD